MQEYLNALFLYNNGILYWKLARSNRIQVGSIAGTPTGNGYLKVSVDKQYLKVHRIIWIMHFGEIAEGYNVDHINGDKLDNRIENLRLATNTENQHNRKATKGKNFKGVNFDKVRNKWKAEIRVDNISYHIGRFDTEEEAHEAYCTVAKDIHGSFFRKA